MCSIRLFCAISRTNRYLDFPDLVQTLIADQQKVIGYPFDGYWQDLGVSMITKKRCKILKRCAINSCQDFREKCPVQHRIERADHELENPAC